MSRLVLYDARCGLCSGSVAWLARHDRRGALAFSSIDSPEGAPYRRAAYPPGEPTRPDTLVLVERSAAGEVVRVRSDAVAAALRGLGLPWSLAGFALGALPSPIADAVYRTISRLRRRA